MVFYLQLYYSGLDGHYGEVRHVTRSKLQKVRHLSSFISLQPSTVSKVVGPHLHDIEQFDDKHLRRERQSVSLILGEENLFPVRRSKMASGYDTPPGGV